MQHDDNAFDLLHAEFGDAVTGPHRGDNWSETSDPWIGVEAPRWGDVARWLRDTPGLEYDCLNNLCVVDYLPTDKKVAKAVGEERLEVVYHLSSLARRRRLTLKVTLPRWRDGEAGQLPEVPSVAPLWKTADWHECEAYDLSGVRFTGHPNLRRLLCPDDWQGHPLRKDYQMPEEYQGIRGR